MKVRQGLFVLGLILTAGIACAQTVEMSKSPVTVSPRAEVGSKVRIKWNVLKEAGVVLQVVDVSGKILRTIDAGRMPPGEYSAVFDGKDASGNNLQPGNYTIRLSVNLKADPDMSFGVSGLLGTVSKKIIFKKERKINLDAKGIDPKNIKVRVDGEEWAREDGFSFAGNNYVFNSSAGTIEFNPSAALNEGAEIVVSYSAGLALENPWAVKTSPDGSLYIADNLGQLDAVYKKPTPREGFIYKVDSAGKPVADFGVNGILRLSVRDIAVDKDGNLYVILSYHDIGVYGPKGDTKYRVAGWADPARPGEHTYEGGFSPAGIAINEEKIMVIVNINQTTLIYDATKSNFEGFVAVQTAKEGVFHPPVWGGYYGPCVAIRDSYFYQTTLINSLVKYKFDRDTKKFSTIWTTPQHGHVSEPRGASDIFHAMGIELDGTGLIYVADRMNHRVQVFYDAGESYKHVGSVGSKGTDVSKCQMMAPHAVALSPDKKSLYVADDGFFYKFHKSPVVKGLGRVTKLKIGFQEVLETPLVVK